MPDRPMDMPIAAEEMGRVSATPMTAATIKPVIAADSVDSDAAHDMN